MKVDDPEGLRAQLRHRRWRRRALHLQQYLRRLRRPAIFSVRRRLAPASDVWGYDRGTPVDRYYIRRFIARHRRDISGHTLEVRDSYYSRWAGVGVTEQSILDIDPTNPDATLIADLGEPESLPAAAFDCFVLMQTLHLIPDLGEALRNAHRCLRPGGVLLATVPAVNRIVEGVGVEGDYWRLTPASARRIFGEVFGLDNVEIHTDGNLLTTTAFLTGLACEELTARELDHRDERFPLLVSVRAVRAG